MSPVPDVYQQEENGKAGLPERTGSLMQREERKSWVARKNRRSNAKRRTEKLGYQKEPDVYQPVQKKEAGVSKTLGVNVRALKELR